MNQREKVIEAINAYERCIAKRESQAAALDEARRAEEDACQNVVRVLHAVYGERASKGCVLRGKQYRVEPGRKDIGQADWLCVETADFEVLG